MSFQKLCFILSILSGAFFSISQSTLPVTLPQLVNVYCNTDADCPTYILPRCKSDHSCGSCNDDSQCNHLMPSGTGGNCNDGICYVPCSSSNYEICMIQRVACDTDINRCRQCQSKSDCSQFPGYPNNVWCKTNSVEANFCANCEDNGDCATGTCQNYKCVQCSSDTDCSSPNPFCYQSFQANACKPCKNSDNSYCTSASSSRCDGYDCVACVGDGDCSHISGKPICSGGVCVECSSSTTCNADPAKSVCTNKVCSMCTQDSDCPSNFPSLPKCAANVGCVECYNSDSCTNPLKSLCDGSSLSCKVCSSNSDCSKFSSTPICSMTSAGCIACTANTDCQDVTKSYCDVPNSNCIACVDGSDQCSHLAATPYCVGSKCVGCRDSLDCSSPSKSVCNPTTLVCELCPDNGGCSHLASTPLCSVSNSRCVECLSSSTDCTTASKSKCDSITKTCQVCSDNSQCSHIPSAPVCIASGCVECGTNNHCMKTSLSYCSPSSYQCEACKADSDCVHIPNMNKCWGGECVIYSATCSPQYYIQIVQNKAVNIFTLTFPLELVSKIDIMKNLQLTLEDVNPSSYTYTLAQITSTEYQANFKVQKTIPKTKLEIQLPCPTQPGRIYGNITEVASTKKIPFATDAMLATMQTIGTAVTTSTTSVSVISAAMMFIGANPAILWALIGLLQTFYYMLFINVQYPANVQEFFPIFTLGNLDFLPNPMGLIFRNIDQFSLSVPQKFAEYDVDGLFLANSGNMLLLWFLNIVAYGISYLFLRYTRNMPSLITKVCSKTVSVFEWSGTFRTFITSFMDVSVSSFLQLRVLTFSSGLFFTSSLCGIMFGTFSVFLPVLAFKIVQKYDIKPTFITLKFGTLIEEYKLNDGIQKYFTVILMGKNLLFAATLVYLHDYPYIEILTLISLSFSYVHLLWKYRPYEQNITNYLNLISEGVFGIIYIFIFILIHDDYSPSFTDDSRIDIGWGIILGCGLILLSSIVQALVEQYAVIKNGIIMLKNVLRKGSNRADRLKRFNARINRIAHIPDTDRQHDFTEQVDSNDKHFTSLSRNAQLKLMRLKRVKKGFHNQIK